jgi:hypothetical protein
MADAGRPSVYTPEIAQAIVSRMCEGESLRSICEESNMPARSTVLLWVVENREGFSDQYAQAMLVRAMEWADETIGIADNTDRDWTVDEHGNLRVQGEHVQRSKLRVDTRKWMISKLLPKVYGDRITSETTNLNVDVSTLTDDQLQRIKEGEDVLSVIRSPSG